jgi:hypothetical protein
MIIEEGGGGSQGGNPAWSSIIRQRGILYDMMTAKDEQAYTVAAGHYWIDPDTVAIWRIVGPNEEDADEPVKLLMVHPDTVKAGIVPVRFRRHPTSGRLFSFIIVEVTPDEFEDIIARKLPLRDGWELGSSIARPVSVGATA